MSRERIGRMGKALGALGDGEFFDYGVAADVDIPADQTNWSGDYAISPEGTMTGSSIYGNTGDSIQWNWGGSGGQDVVAMETTPGFFSFDPGAMLDAGRKYGSVAVDLYKRTKGGTPAPTRATAPNAPTTTVRTASGFDISKLIPIVAAIAVVKAIT